MQLTTEEGRIYELAQVRAKDYLSAEAAMLDSIVEIDRSGLYKKFDEAFLTPFCVKHFRLSEEVAAKRAQARKVKSKNRSEERSHRRPIPAGELHTVNLLDQRRCQHRMLDGSICAQTRWVQIHHIVEVSQGGSNRAENLMTLCSHHHRIGTLFRRRRVRQITSHDGQAQFFD